MLLGSLGAAPNAPNVQADELSEAKARQTALKKQIRQQQAVELADEVIRVPVVPEFLQPIVAAIPLQLLAYHAAVLRGCDVDKPRNLAKSVTVE